MKDFFKANVLVYRLSGIFLHSPGKRVAEMAWSFLVYCPTTVYLVLEMMILRQNVHDIERFLSQTSIFLTHLLGITKVVLLVLKHKKLMALQDSLLSEDFFYEDYEGFSPKVVMKRAMEFSTKVSLTIYWMYSFVGGSAWIATELTIITQVKDDILPDNITCSDFMQYYFYIPWDSRTKTNCRLTNFFMSYCITCYAFFIASHDGMYAALLNCLKARLDVLCGAMTTVKPRILKRLNLDKTAATNVELVENELYYEMKKFNRNLMLLLKCGDEIEDVFSLLILMQTTFSIVIMASTLFYAANLPLTSPVFFSQLQYFLCILIQLTLFCWFGSGVTHASGQIIDCLYDSDWYEASKRFKSSMLTMMCRMQRPIYLTIGKFSPLTLNIIVTVIKASASYYAVFKSVSTVED